VDAAAAREIKAGTEAINPIVYGKLKIIARVGELWGRHQGKKLPLPGKGSSSATLADYRKVADNAGRIGEYKVGELWGRGSPGRGKKNPLPGEGFSSATLADYRKVADNAGRIGEYKVGELWGRGSPGRGKKNPAPGAGISEHPIVYGKLKIIARVGELWGRHQGKKLSSPGLLSCKSTKATYRKVADNAGRIGEYYERAMGEDEPREMPITTT